jgi:hypothetical protein
MHIKKIFLVIIQVLILSIASFAQSDTCDNPPTCIIEDIAQVTDIGTAFWYASHGNPSFANYNAPTSKPGSKSLYMQSLDRFSNGFFTCYKFERGNTYRICFWAKHYNPNWGFPNLMTYPGVLKVFAANGLVERTPHPFPMEGTPVHLQLPLYSTWLDLFSWSFISFTFTPGIDWNQLWFYPSAPSNEDDNPHLIDRVSYYVAVDDIRIAKVESPTDLYINDSKPIKGCNGSADIEIQGMTGDNANTIATWTPAPNPGDMLNSNGSHVIMRPCSTTTYKIEISDPWDLSAPACPNCTRKVLYHTVEVEQWGEPDRIKYPTTVIPCTTPFDLAYDNDKAPLCDVEYTWVEPDKVTTHNGRTVHIDSANAYQTGEWTLRIHNNIKGCDEEFKFHISVGSCCISNPNFTFTNNMNPVTFVNTGNGITNHISTSWSFGDGTTSDLDNPIHTYDVAQTTNFTVCLTTLYEDGQGESCCDRICKTVTVSPNQNACTVTANYDYGPDINQPNTLIFYDASSGSGTICGYEWIFYDDAALVVYPTTSPTITHNFPLTGPYSTGPWYVCLKTYNCMYDEDGNLIKTCTDEKCDWVSMPSFKTTKPGITTTSTQPKYNILADKPASTKLSSGKGLMVYPNPNTGNFTVNLQKRAGNYRIVVRDKLSREVYNKEHSFNMAPVKISLDDVPNGMYSVEITGEKEKFVESISIVR